ncbi:hypothetical protein N8139_04230, partial [Schleiferiaceae bacterium]|nr:hypothetical protein [Schleiferiaceae bacterium]
MEHWAQNWIVLVKKGPLVTTQELGTDLTFYKATIMVYLMETDLRGYEVITFHPNSREFSPYICGNPKFKSTMAQSSASL